eukprot:PRCOL_00002711-RA
MPTCTLVTTAQPNPARAKAVLEHGLTSVLSEGASVPREYVHIHAVFGAQGTFGAVSDTPWAQLRIAVIKGQLSPEKKAAVAEGVTKACAVLEVEADRVQVVYEELDRGNIAIGGKTLTENI